MLVDEWVETVWTILNVRGKTLKDYKHLYKSHLKLVIEFLDIDSVSSSWRRVSKISPVFGSSWKIQD